VGRFGSVITAMVTPFDHDGAVDLGCAEALAGHLVASGSDGLVVAGTTGEGPVLSDAEKLELFRVVAAAVDVPVLAATGSNDTAHSAALSRSAAGCGVDGLLVVTPYYNRPSRQGLSSHFRSVAAPTDQPVVLYDIPVRTGRKIGTELLIELATEVPTIVGVKDATGGVAAAAVVVASTPEEFEVYAGDDSLTLPFLSVGAVGIVSVASHWAAPRFVEMVAAFERGDTAGAIAANQRLAGSFSFESSDEYPNPVPAKAACRALGFAVGQCRLPNAPAPEALVDQARAVIAELDLPISAAARQTVA
jgi:4-hydroxy-tetrahydrodipicolinate synthase